MRSRVWLALLVTCVIIASLLLLFDPLQIPSILLSMNLLWVALALFLHACTYFSRGMTFFLLLPAGGVSVWQLFRVHCYHNFFNMVLPARTGELSYPYLLKKRYGLPSSQSVPNLVVARLLDLLTVPAFCLAALWVWWLRGQKTLEGVSGWHVAGLVGLLVLLGTGIWFFPLCAEVCTRGLRWVGRRARFNKNRHFLKVLGKADEIVASLHSIGKPTVLLKASFWAMLSRLLNFLMLFVTLKGAGLPCELWQLVLGSTLAMLTNVLPVNGVGSFGPFEGGWAAGFLVLGFSRQFAFESGFVVHIMALVYASVLMGVVWISERLVTALRHHTGPDQRRSSEQEEHAHVQG